MARFGIGDGAGAGGMPGGRDDGGEGDVDAVGGERTDTEAFAAAGHVRGKRVPGVAKAAKEHGVINARFAKRKSNASINRTHCIRGI